MSGKPIEAVQNGLATLLPDLGNKPQDLDETVYLSIITFDDTARQVIPLTELNQFRIPQLKVKAGSGATLGAALRLVSECAEREVVKHTPEAKGDWTPLVFLMTDGHATDDIREDLAVFKKSNATVDIRFKKRKWGEVVACAASTNANENVLKSITETVVRLDTINSGGFQISSFPDDFDTYLRISWGETSFDNSTLDDQATMSEDGLEDLPFLLEDGLEDLPFLFEDIVVPLDPPDPDHADTLPLGDSVGSAPESSSSSSSPAEDVESAGENQGTSSEDAMEDLLLPPEITLL
jgi:uncharacterized protein YegL